MKFSEKLIFLRKQKGISQEELADILDVSRQSVYKWESGANMPDIAKIEKLTVLFDVSFNYLLDDKIEIPHREEPSSTVGASKTEFREVFVSSTELDSDLAAYEHGYGPETECDHKVDDGEERFDALRAEVDALMKERGYENVIFPQFDMCLCYFENPKEKTFGFYFDGAEQFVCPFENFVDVHLSDDGYGLNYDKRAPVFGVGVGAYNSYTVGSVPQASLEGPSFFDIVVVYFDVDGNTCEYKLHLSSNRVYMCYHHSGFLAKRGEAESMMYVLGEGTKDGLNKIAMKLKAVAVKGNMIRAREIKVEPIDIDKYAKAADEAYELSCEEKGRIEDEYNESSEKSLLLKWIAFALLGVVGVILVIVILTALF